MRKKTADAGFEGPAEGATGGGRAEVEGCVKSHLRETQRGQCCGRRHRETNDEDGMFAPLSIVVGSKVSPSSWQPKRSLSRRQHEQGLGRDPNGGSERKNDGKSKNTANHGRHRVNQKPQRAKRTASSTGEADKTARALIKAHKKVREDALWRGWVRQPRPRW